MAESRPPFPPFTLETATQKVRMAEDAWNTRDPQRVALGYTIDSRWRNRSEFLRGRAEIEAFLSRKWQREVDYRLIKEIWTIGFRRAWSIAGYPGGSVAASVDAVLEADQRRLSPRSQDGRPDPQRRVRNGCDRFLTARADVANRLVQPSEPLRSRC